MPAWLDDLGVYALLALIWIGAPTWIGSRLWSRHRRGRIRAEPVEGARPPPARHEVAAQIDAEPIRDYRGPGRRGESFFQVGGLAILGWFAFATLLSVWFSSLFEPLGRWAGDVVRRALN